ncbi:hypothetical protein GGTG_12061 [Gaeumannomyces tritici R3-111a-1]|uniref:Glycosyl hydrolase family 13 catalytic domain-containing protein n=1 Tax=Gaeumannomyces tritici (strain R3-111a-1) TaxID=644352 RepID=J3PEY2_GAET3|nr:hypothetical protein GGTG_12061 [Gaeumannomyces tritici R3-111a-1]EJT71040.1 hypothetical protein GGTG_12061 [Gaeumannomyces tritici R3-111a-1]
MPTDPNPCLFQAFEWYSRDDGQHWRRLSRDAPRLAALGVTTLWIPPAAKAASGASSNGYDAYDLYDLGEFDQRGTARTKWGTKAELVELADVAAAHGLDLLFDAVLNHKAGADGTDRVKARRVDPEDRRKFVGPTEEVAVWTRFESHGSGPDSFRWFHSHFTGVDYDDLTQKKGIWLLDGKTWADDVSTEFGNFDYLMFADIDHHHPDVRQELFHWAEWLDGELRIGGLRLDAAKHYSWQFVRDMLAHVDEARRRRLGDGAKPWLVVAEHTGDERGPMEKYLDLLQDRVSLFDFPLLMNFCRASYDPNVDLRKIFAGALCETRPKNAVTFIMNHDTQPGQAIETPISPWFVPAAYALILLRADAGLPCVFHAHLHGSRGPSRENPFAPPGSLSPPLCGGAVLPRLMLARRLYAYGPQVDYFDDAACVGFVRLGHADHAAGAGLAVLINAGWKAAGKRMRVGRRAADAGVGRGDEREVWTDLLGWSWGELTPDEDGWATFHVGPRSVAVWGPRDAPGRELVDGVDGGSPPAASDTS